MPVVILSGPNYKGGLPTHRSSQKYFGGGNRAEPRNKQAEQRKSRRQRGQIFRGTSVRSPVNLSGLFKPVTLRPGGGGD